MQIRHYILTRFNLALWRKDKNGHPTRDELWLANRFDLFERYTLPSVMNQSNKDFLWIVLFDSETPEPYRERVKRWADIFPNFRYVPVRAAQARWYPRIWAEYIRRDLQRMSDGAVRVVTSWLDNDDLIGSDYVATVQRDACKMADGVFFFYRKGIQYFLEDRYALQIVFPNNHFVSRVEDMTGDGSPVRTVYEYGTHYDLPRIKSARLLFIDNAGDKPLWAEVVHGRNVDNDVKMRFNFRFVKDATLMRWFALDTELRTDSLYLCKKFIPRAARRFVFQVKRKLCHTPMG